MHCYLEIENIKSISTFQITNKVLFDMFEDQKNVIRTNINNKKKIPNKAKYLIDFMK